MENVFATNRDRSRRFKWENLGDIKKGRSELGEEMPVLLYRLLEYSIMDVLTRNYGDQQTDEYFREAGYLAGMEFAKNTLKLDVDFDSFVATLQEVMRDLKIGILRMEEFDSETGDITLTIGEDLECSGLPVTNENVCVYDEGFIAGILKVYTGKSYKVNEIDCWASGDRVCRFRGKVQD